MVTENHYRWDFIGLSTDEKPTPATSEKVVDGSTFYCSDTSKLYVYCKDNWYERKALGGGGGGGDINVVQTTGTSTTDVMSQKAVTDALASAGGGGVKTLTSADYNYHYSGSVDDGIALWLLDVGEYIIGDGTQLKIYFLNNDNISTSSIYGAIVLKKPSGNDRGSYIFTNGNKTRTEIVTGVDTSGSNGIREQLLVPIINNLSDTSTNKALSANMGRELYSITQNIQSNIVGKIFDSSIYTPDYDSTGENPDEYDSYAVWNLCQSIDHATAFYLTNAYTNDYPIYIDNENQNFVNQLGVLTIIAGSAGDYYIKFEEFENDGTSLWHIDGEGNIM